MVILGTALLAACYLVGMLIGTALAALIGVKANVGGVGIAMLLLIGAQHLLRKRGLFSAGTERGVAFWAMMYIPIVVAMAAGQNVLVAVKSGPMAVLCAVGAVVLCFFTISLVNRLLPEKAFDWSTLEVGDAPPSALSPALAKDGAAAPART